MHFLQKYHFNEQHDDEQIIQVIHRHWFDILIRFAAIIFISSLIFGSIFFFLFSYPELLAALGYQVVFFVETTALIFVWFYGFLIWINYYLDVWIITNQRIVNIEQKGLFLREASELQFEKIQDVSTNVSGLIPTVLNYGDVFIQTAGEQERFRFRHVPKPYVIKELIMQIYNKTTKNSHHI